MSGVAQQSSAPIEMESTSSPSQPVTGMDRSGNSDKNSNQLLSHGLESGNSQSEEIQRLESEQNAPVARSNWKIFLTMIALSLALFISALDQTIVATATPTIASELHSASGYVWIGGAYLLANAASSNIWANLSDIWGRKLVLLTAVALFFGASIICATAVDMPMLIAGRGLQGIAGGGLIQLITITISDLFSVRLRSLFMGLIEFIWAIAGAMGPLVGGAFTQSVSWRWIFWINLPVCGTAFVLLFLFLDIHNPRTPVLAGIKAVDWWGSFSMLALIILLLLGLDFGGATFPWDSPKVICLIVFGALMSVAFIYSEKRLAKYPLMPLGVFHNRSNVACFLVAFTHGFAFLGSEYYLPTYFQSAKEATPFHSGLMILPFVLTEAALSLFAGLFIHGTGRYLEIVWTGTTLVVLGPGLFVNLDTGSSLGKIVGYQIVAGMGCGLLFFPPLLALQSNVTQRDTASATATFGFIRNVAMAMSVVLGGVVFQNSMEMRQGDLRAAGLSSAYLDEFSGSEAASNVVIISTIQEADQRHAVATAYAWSLRNMWILYACVAAVGFVASMFITRQHLSKEHVETKTGLKEKESTSS